MAKSPETPNEKAARLAAALRANLRRRKAPKPAKEPEVVEDKPKP